MHIHTEVASSPSALGHMTFNLACQHLPEGPASDAQLRPKIQLQILHGRQSQECPGISGSNPHCHKKKYHLRNELEGLHKQCCTAKAVGVGVGSHSGYKQTMGSILSAPRL